MLGPTEIMLVQSSLLGHADSLLSLSPSRLWLGGAVEMRVSCSASLSHTAIIPVELRAGGARTISSGICGPSSSTTIFSWIFMMRLVPAILLLGYQGDS